MLWIWLGFIALVLALLALDLGVFNREAHVVKVKEALGWSALWITLGLLFSIFVYYGYDNHWLGLGAGKDPVDGLVNNGQTAALKYLTGYIVEKSLSVDNIFVIAMLFAFFGVPAIYQHRVLFWGILGALIMRGAMIGIGAKLVAEFHWVLYIFGVILILTAVKMLFMKEHEADPNQNILVKWVRRVFPITERFHGEHFWVRAGSKASSEPAVKGGAIEQDHVAEAAKVGTLMLTPLMLALIVIEFTDVVFAVDSIPAIFAITGDAFLVFTSNVFAIMGLRSLYFALAGMIGKFRYLKVSLAFVLALVGVKMLVASWLKVLMGEHSDLYLLGAILGILAAGVVASLIADARDNRRAAMAG